MSGNCAPECTGPGTCGAGEACVGGCCEPCSLCGDGSCIGDCNLTGCPGGSCVAGCCVGDDGGVDPPPDMPTDPPMDSPIDGPAGVDMITGRDCMIMSDGLLIRAPGCMTPE
jgi:hypothetical protein